MTLELEKLLLEAFRGFQMPNKEPRTIPMKPEWVASFREVDDAAKASIEAGVKYCAKRNKLWHDIREGVGEWGKNLIIDTDNWTITIKE